MCACARGCYKDLLSVRLYYCIYLFPVHSYGFTFSLFRHLIFSSRICVSPALGEVHKEEDGSEPEWVQGEREQFNEHRDLNKDGKMDKVRGAEAGMLLPGALELSFLPHSLYFKCPCKKTRPC